MPAIRDDFEKLKARVARGGGSGLQATTFLGKTVAVAAYPTAANRFYMVAPLAVAGLEGEGEWASMTAAPADRAVPAYNVGGGVPPVGTAVVVFSVPNRLVFTYG